MRPSIDLIRQHVRRVLPMLCSMIAMSGCGAGNDGPVMIDSVSGTVTIDGNAVHPASVEFWLDRQSHAAPLDESGSFEFESALAEGSYRVTIGMAPPPAAPTDDTPPPNADVPQKYRLPTTSGLTAEVNEESDSFTFDLKP